MKPHTRNTEIVSAPIVKKAVASLNLPATAFYFYYPLKI